MNVVRDAALPPPPRPAPPPPKKKELIWEIVQNWKKLLEVRLYRFNHITCVHVHVKYPKQFPRKCQNCTKKSYAFNFKITRWTLIKLNCLIAGRRTTHNPFTSRDKPWDPYGIAKFDLSGLLLGQTCLNLRSPIHCCPLPDTHSGLQKPDGPVVGQPGNVDGPGKSLKITSIHGTLAVARASSRDSIGERILSHDTRISSRKKVVTYFWASVPYYLMLIHCTCMFAKKNIYKAILSSVNKRLESVIKALRFYGVFFSCSQTSVSYIVTYIPNKQAHQHFGSSTCISHHKEVKPSFSIRYTFET